MRFMRMLHVRAAVVALAALVSVGAGAAYAATRAAKTAAIGTGVVVIDTNLAYENGAAAGTGMVLTPSGEILTNNHVIEGATTIKVAVPGTAHRYTARVVGYSVSNDVAILQLQNAPNLKTVSTANSAALRLGAKVTAVGNAGGTGTLTSSSGTVTGLARSITVQDDSGGAQRMSGLIETNAGLQPGDSGGPLLNGAGRVVGMDTAGSVGGGRFTAYAASDGYAIPINTALRIARQIEAGTATVGIHLGATPFLGVGIESVQSSPYDTGATSGLVVANVVSDGSAARAGLVAGDVITAVDGKAVATQRDVQSILLAHRPGDTIRIAYLDAGSGQAQSTTATLASGPPQ